MNKIDNINNYIYGFILNSMRNLLIRFENLPDNYTGNCKHNVGIIFADGINCTICGYFVDNKIRKIDL